MTLSVRNKPNPDTAHAPAVGLREFWEAGTIPPHRHLRHQLLYSVKGVMHITTPLGRWVLSPSQAIWIAAGTEHTFLANRAVELQVLYIQEDFMPTASLGNGAVIGVTPLVRELLEKGVDLPWNYQRHSPEERLIKVLLEQIVEVPFAPIVLPEPEDGRARKVVEILRRNLALRYPLEQLAAEVGASSRTIERIFRAETGMSFCDWRHRLRLLVALEKLADGMSVAMAGAEIGYENPSSFIFAFKRHFSATPGSFFGRKV